MKSEKLRISLCYKTIHFFNISLVSASKLKLFMYYLNFQILESDKSIESQATTYKVSNLRHTIQNLRLLIHNIQL